MIKYISCAVDNITNKTIAKLLLNLPKQIFFFLLEKYNWNLYNTYIISNFLTIINNMDKKVGGHSVVPFDGLIKEVSRPRSF